MSAAGLREGFVLLALVALPLSTAAHEVSMAVLLAWVVVAERARPFAMTPWAAGAVASAVVCVLGGWASGNLREGWGQAWLLAPLVALAAPVEAPLLHRRMSVGLWAAGGAAAIALVQAAGGAAGRGLFSHHLSLAYSLLFPFGVALAGRRWGLAALLAAGVLSARSDAAPIALVATAAAVALKRPLVALGGGAAATLVALGAFANVDELRQRAVLWTGGLLVAPGEAGAGGYAAASSQRYEALSPGFWFPNHAHDNVVQLGATLGAGGLVAFALLLLVALRRGHPGAAAGLVGVLVGGLTQNTLGDLEVARSGWVWLAILGTVGQAGGQSVPCCPSSSPPPSPAPSIRP